MKASLKILCKMVMVKKNGLMVLNMMDNLKKEKNMEKDYILFLMEINMKENG